MAEQQDSLVIEQHTSQLPGQAEVSGQAEVDVAPSYPSAQVRTDGSQARYDSFQGRWVVYAPHRGFRPNDFSEPPQVAAEELLCPFCSGNESQTPPAVLTVPDDAESKSGHPRLDTEQNKWAVRVVPNKYPAVMSADGEVANDLWTKSFARWSAREQNSAELHGGHEVIIESSAHAASWTQLDLVNVECIFQAWKQRLQHWREQPSIRYMSLFKNVGRDAGASLQHSHSQLIVMGQLPVSVQETLSRMEKHQARTGCCMQCDVLRHELKSRERIIAHVDDVVAFCPFASSFGMAVKITTSHHVECFEDLSDKMLSRIAGLVQRVTGWLEKTRPGVAYNYVLNTRPPNWKGDPGAYHWSIDVLPRISHIAGFEIGSGTMLNSVLPEVAAAQYRRLAAAENPSAL